MIFATALQIGFSAQSIGNFPSALKVATRLTTRIYEIATYYFKLIDSLSLVGCSIKELLIDYLPASLKTSSALVLRAAERHFRRIQDIISSQFLGRGVFFGGSGILKTCASLNELHLLGLGKALPLFSVGGLGLFLFGSLFSLERNARIFQEACKMEDSGVASEQELARKIKFSAVIGMVADLSSLISTVFSLFQAGTALCIILGCFALFSISLKNIYDFFFLSMLAQS